MKDEGEGPTVRVRVTGARHSIKQLVHVCVCVSLSQFSFESESRESAYASDCSLLVAQEKLPLLFLVIIIIVGHA